ncbi:MAG: glycosyl hydrolase [Gemmatimonadetes bacterium]|nr:glycosyl hydrolase [Gemmatimonadota bacterium]
MSKLAFLLALALAPSVVRAQWTPQSSGTTAEFRGLVAVSPSVVWASGTRGRVARTTDGGKTWRVDTIPGATKLDLRGIAALGTSGATRAWAMSAGLADSGQAQIYHTADGTHWTKQFETMQKGVFLDAIAFWDEKHGIAMSDPVDGKLFILTTDDGGATWSHVPTESAPPVLPGEAAFAASGTCLTVQGRSNVWIGTGGSARARVFRSTDRGRTWRVADTPVHAGGSASGIFSVAFRDARHGVVVGGDYTKPKEPSDNVALTDDGGESWRLASGALPKGYMSGVAYLPGTSGRSLVAVGLGGTARSSDGGQSWAMVDSVAYNSVAFATRDDGWAAGPGGRIARWTPSTAQAAKP